MPRLDLEHPAVGGDRPIAVVQVIALEGAQGEQRALPHALIHRGLHPLLQELAQIGIAPLLAIELGQRIEGVGVVGVGLQHGAPGALRRHQVAELLRRQAGPLARQGAHLRRRRAAGLRRGESAIQDLRQLAVAPEGAGERAQRRPRLRIRRLGLDDALGGGPRRALIVQLPVIEAEQLAVQLQLLRRVGVGGAAHQLERDGQLGGRARGGEVRRQLAGQRHPLLRGDGAARPRRPQVARQDRHRRVGRLARRLGRLQRRHVVRQRAVRAIQALRLQPADAQRQLDAPRGVVLARQLAHQGAHQSLPVAARLVHPRQRAQRHRRALVDGQHLLVGLRRRVEIDQLLLLDGGQLEQEPGAVGGVLLPAQLVQIDGAQVGPVGELQRDLLEL